MNAILECPLHFFGKYTASMGKISIMITTHTISFDFSAFIVAYLGYMHVIISAIGLLLGYSTHTHTKSPPPPCQKVWNSIAFFFFLEIQTNETLDICDALQQKVL